MSSLRVIKSPRFVDFIARENLLVKKPFVLIDIGARKGFEEHWKNFGNQIKIIGFEPDEEECNRLNRIDTGFASSYYPIALHKARGTKKFRLMIKREASTFSIPNMSLLRRLRDEESFVLDKTVNIKTLDLDSFAQREKIKYIDFMKLDVEGCELDILKGSKKFLKGSILGLSLEIQFNNLFDGGPLFGEVDSFVRKFGFQLYDLGLIRLKRKPLSFEAGFSNFGQLIAGHALYLKDPVEELNKKVRLDEHGFSTKKKWSTDKILKMIGVMELYNLPDCAIELAIAAKSHGYLTKLNINEILNLLTPQVGGKIMPYKKYLRYIKNKSRQHESIVSNGLKFIIRNIPPNLRMTIKKCFGVNNWDENF